MLTAALSLPTGVFKYNHLVKKLNLSGLGIEADAASVLAIAVTHNTTLTSIDLSNNPLSDVSVYTGATQHETTGLYALAEAVKVNKSLDAITLEGGKLPVDQLKGDKKLRSLDLSRKALGFVSAIFIGTLLRGNTFLTELVLHSNE